MNNQNNFDQHEIPANRNWRNRQNNNNIYQGSGNPRPQQQQGGRPPRPRDAYRMAEFNMNRHDQKNPGNTGWANQVRIEEQLNEAVVNVRPRSTSNKSNRSNSPPPNKRSVPVIKPSTAETAPKDEQLYSGNGSGSKPVKKALGQNFDIAGFIPFVKQTYELLCIENPRLPRSLPFCIFQHAMVEHLTAYMLHKGKFEQTFPALQSILSPLDAIKAESLNVPQPFYEYICGIGTVVTPTGDKVKFNYPTAGVPRGRINENVSL